MRTLSHLTVALPIALAFALIPSEACAADTTAPDLARDRQLRERYETVLLRNPFQERSFNAVYEGYAKVEGVDAWVEKLKPQTTAGTNTQTALLLLGQIYDRQFKPADAVETLEKAAASGETRPQFKVLLGTLYYKTGKDEPAAKLLGESLDALSELDLDQRSSVCRMLGNVYLRQGKRDEAIAAWKRIAELNPGENLAQTELAEIYQDNRLWDEAVVTYRRIAEASKSDPYRRCRALRSAGECLVQAEKHKDALAVFEEALGLVAPGTWLFDDLAIRLVSVYEDLGDLDGLAKYLQARLEQSPNDADYRGLLAETYTRMGRLDRAEQANRTILERNPRNTSVHEKLLALYVRQEKTNAVIAGLEKLITLFPNETDYVRRLGEAHLRAGDQPKALETWQRLVQAAPTGERYVELAGWLEGSELTKEAIAAYEQALQRTRNKEWVFRLATLKFKAGAEPDAVKLWLSVIDPQKSKAPDFVEVATILEANQRFEEAGALRKRAMDLDSADPEIRLAYARNLMSQKKHEEALVEFNTLSSATNNEYLKLQGERGRLDAYAELGLLAEKRAEWERALEANPRSAQQLEQLAQLYQREGQREKAVQLYERRRELEPGNSEFLRELAEAYKSARKEPQAIAAFKELAEKDKTRARAYLKDLLDLYLASDSKTDAIATAEKMVDLAPADAEAHLELAQVYLLYRETNKGLEEHRAAIRLKPSEPEYHRQYGEALANANRWGEAQESYRKALDAAQDDELRLTLVQSLARIHFQQGKLEELVSEFSRRIRNTPKRLSAYEELSAIHHEAGQTDKALQVLENGLAAVDDKVAALRVLLRASYEARDLPKVRNYFEQLVSLSGRPTVAEYERLAGLYSKLGDFEKARATWKKVIELAGNDARTIRRAAGSMRKENLIGEATAALNKVLEMDPYDFRTRYDLAQMQITSGRNAEALDQLRKLLELGENKDRSVVVKRPRSRGARGGAQNPFSMFLGPQGLSRIISSSGGGGTITSSGGFTYYLPAGGGAPVIVSSPSPTVAPVASAGVGRGAAGSGRGALPPGTTTRVITNSSGTVSTILAPITPMPPPVVVGGGGFGSGGSGGGFASGASMSISGGPAGGSFSTTTVLPPNSTVGTLTGSTMGGRLVSTISGSPGSRTWQGTYDEFKPQVILQAASLAKTSSRVTEFIKPFEERATKEPGNLEAQRELIMVLLACDRSDDALELGEKGLIADPNDFDLLQAMAQFCVYRGRSTRAITLYERLLEKSPQHKSEATRGLIPLYFQNDKTEKGEALANEALVLSKNDYPALMTLGSTLQQARRLDLARSVYEKALEGDPANRKNVLFNLANLNRQDGKPAEAIKNYKQILWEPDSSSSLRPSGVYSPVRLTSPTTSSSVSPAVRLRSIPPTVLGTPDSLKLNALSQLLTLAQTDRAADVLPQLEKEVRQFQSGTNQDQRTRDWEMAKMLCLYYLSEDRYETAGDLLRFFQTQGQNDDDWFSLVLYLENRKDNYAGMIPYYDQLARRSPSRTREIQIAKTRALTLAKEWEKAARLMQEMPPPQLSASEFNSLLQPLSQANQNPLVRKLVEERLASGPRDSELLALLARACAAEGDYDRAIELAEEAWQRKPNTPAAPRMTSTPSPALSSVLIVNPGAAVDIDGLLRDMHRYYSAKGKRDDLMARFEKRLAEQPDTQRAYENLAQLYRLDGQTDKATEIYQKLLQKFPASVPARLAMGSYLVDRGEFTKAIQLYEDLKRTNPDWSPQVEAWLRTLRQRAAR